MTTIPVQQYEQWDILYTKYTNENWKAGIDIRRLTVYYL